MFDYQRVLGMVNPFGIYAATSMDFNGFQWSCTFQIVPSPPGLLLQDLCIGLPHPWPSRGGAGAGGSARGGRAASPGAGDGGAPRASLHHGVRAGGGRVGGRAIWLWCGAGELGGIKSSLSGFLRVLQEWVPKKKSHWRPGLVMAIQQFITFLRKAQSTPLRCREPSEVLRHVPVQVAIPFPSTAVFFHGFHQMALGPCQLAEGSPAEVCQLEEWLVRTQEGNLKPGLLPSVSVTILNIAVIHYLHCKWSQTIGLNWKAFYPSVSLVCLY